MFLEKLTSLGAFVGKEDFVGASFEWAPDSDSKPVKFDISIKKELTVADFEFINFGEIGSDDQSVMARRVHRLVRVNAVDGVAVGAEQLPLDQVKQFKPSLLMSFIVALNNVENKAATTAKKQKRKASPRKTSSGASSSLQA